jgi:aminodeoxyfutalosine synthase
MTSIHTLHHIREKIQSGIRLSFEDGIHLFESPQLLQIGEMADIVRRKLHGDYVSFITNSHLNYTNVCYLDCKLCAFGRKEKDPLSYTLSYEQLEQKLNEMTQSSLSELHIVGGVHAKLPFSYYCEMISLAKRILPHVHIQAFTAVEIDYMARVANLSIEQTMISLQAAGLGSILGGGSEIFASDIRKIISGHKTTAERWLDIHRIVHRLGMKSNASILYGHIEKPEHIIDHLIRLRELQDETGGFQTFFGFAFHPANTQLAREYPMLRDTSGYTDLKLLAISRLMLDNIPNIRAFWMAIGLKMAQVSLSFGVNDLDGTVMEEQILHAAGNQSVQLTNQETFIAMIKEAGRIPIERDTLYNFIRTF